MKTRVTITPKVLQNPIVVINTAVSKPDIKQISFECPVFTHIAHISDIHIRPLQRHDEYIDCFNNLYRELTEIATVSKLIIVITGDLFDNKHNFKPETFKLARTFLKQLSTIAHTCIIAGNHDMLEHNTSRLDAISAIIDDIPNLTYFCRSAVYRPSNNPDTVFVVSSLYDKQFISYAEAHELAPECKKIALYHGTISGSTTDTCAIMQNDDSTSSTRFRTVDDFKQFDATLLGDIHKHQLFNATICYAGSLIQQNHGESMDGHGFVMWDPSLFPTHIKINNNWAHVTIEVTDGVITKIPKFTSKNVYLRICHDDTSFTTLSKLITEFAATHNITICKEDYIPIAINANTTEIPHDIIDRQDDVELIQYELKGKDPTLVDRVVDLHKSYCIEQITTMNTAIWRPVWMKFKNLFGYHSGKVHHINLPHGVIGVHGLNHTGKTSIANALLFGLFGKTPLTASSRAYSVDIVNNRESHGFVTVLISHGPHYYLVERKSVRKDSNKKASRSDFINLLSAHTFSLEVHRCDKDGTKLENIASKKTSGTDAALEELIGKIETFIETNLISSASTSILNKTAAERLSSLKTVFGLSVFDYYKKLNADKLKKVEAEITEKHTQLVAITAVKPTTVSSLEELNTKKIQLERDICDLSADHQNIRRELDELVDLKATIRIGTTITTKTDTDINAEILTLSKQSTDHHINVDVCEGKLMMLQKDADTARLSIVPTINMPSLDELNAKIPLLESSTIDYKTRTNDELHEVSLAVGTLTNKIHQKRQELATFTTTTENTIPLNKLTVQLSDSKQELSSLSWFKLDDATISAPDAIERLTQIKHQLGSVDSTIDVEVDQRIHLQNDKVKTEQTLLSLETDRDSTWSGTEDESYFLRLIKPIGNIPQKRAVRSNADKILSQYPELRATYANLLKISSADVAKEKLIKHNLDIEHIEHEKSLLTPIIPDAPTSVEEIMREISSLTDKLSKLYVKPTTLEPDEVLLQHGTLTTTLSGHNHAELLDKKQHLLSMLHGLDLSDVSIDPQNVDVTTLKAQIQELTSSLYPDSSIGAIPTKKSVITDTSTLHDRETFLTTNIAKLRQGIDDTVIEGIITKLKEAKPFGIGTTYLISRAIRDGAISALTASVKRNEILADIEACTSELYELRDTLKTNSDNVAHNTLVDELTSKQQHNHKVKCMISKLQYHLFSQELTNIETLLNKFNLLFTLAEELNCHEHNKNVDAFRQKITSRIEQLHGFKDHLHSVTLNLQQNELVKQKLLCETILAAHEFNDILFNAEIDQMVSQQQQNERYAKIINQINYVKNCIQLQKINEKIARVSLLLEAKKLEQIVHNHTSTHQRTMLTSKIDELNLMIAFHNATNIQQQIDKDVDDLRQLKQILEHSKLSNDLNIARTQRSIYLNNAEHFKKCNVLKTDIQNLRTLISEQQNYDKIVSLKKIIELRAVEKQILALTCKLTDIQHNLDVKNKLLMQLTVDTNNAENGALINDKIQALTVQLTLLDEQKHLLTTYKALVDSKGIPFKMLERKLIALEKDINAIVDAYTEYNVKVIYDETRQSIDFVTQHKYTHNHLSTARMSGYEKVMIELAVKRALNRNSFNSKCSIMIVDEGFDVVDSKKFGLESEHSDFGTFMSVLSHDYATCILISQRDTQHIVNHTLNVNIVKGVPTITEFQYS